MDLELSAEQKKTLKSSSGRGLEKTFGELTRHLARSRWLAQGNRYRSKTVQRLDADANNGGVEGAPLAEYIAASAPLHCTDGWSYLGRALACTSRGDPDAARHLGYYAELRAAMSLLASEGIGVFNDRHFVIDDNGTCQPLPRNLRGRNNPVARTHVLVWLALDYWASLRRSSELLGEIIAPEGIRLREWIASLNAAQPSLPIGGKWLRAWGLDLKRFAFDQQSRNEASYRPTKLDNTSFLPIRETSSFLRSVWGIAEPAGGSRFRNLDRHLLRESLRLAFLPVSGGSARGQSTDFERAVHVMLEDLSITPDVAASLQQYLTRQIEPELPELVKRANGTSNVGEPDHHLQVIARAVLLLRVATGASARLVRAHDLQTVDFEFWWRGLGEGLGLLRVGQSISDLQELWADASEAIVGLADWDGKTPPDQQSCFGWNRDCAEPISVLSGCERIGLWGLGL